MENKELQIVLELADAGDLAQLLRHCQRQRRLLGEKTIWRYFVQLCSALEHMHSKRVMHRGVYQYAVRFIRSANSIVCFFSRYQACKRFYDSQWNN